MIDYPMLVGYSKEADYQTGRFAHWALETPGECETHIDLGLLGPEAATVGPAGHSFPLSRA